MNSMLQSLLWKEWQERKRTFFVCLTWILGGVIYVALYESVLGYRTPVSRFGLVCTVYSLFMTIFLAMRVCLSEVTTGTLSFSSSLPVSLPRIAVVRLGFAIFTLAGPILLGALILAVLLGFGVLEQIPTRSEGFIYGTSILKHPSLSATAAVIFLGKITCITVAQAVAFFLILAVIGTRCRQEAHIGFFGAAFSFAWVILREARIILQSSEFAPLQDWIGAFFPHTLAVFSSSGDGRGSFSRIDLAYQIWMPLFLNLIILSVLGFWFTRRYGTGNGFVSRQKYRWNWPSLFSWVSFHHRREASSLIWINIRQAVPLALAGLALACVGVMVDVLSGSHVDQITMDKMSNLLPSDMSELACLWATVVGSGIFAAELTPNLRHFWMSRPISIGRWFWFKYLVGLFVVLLVLDGTTIVVSWDSIYEVTSNSSNRSRNFLSWSYIVCFPILHSMMYSLAVLGVCWWKKPIRGAVSAIAFLLVGSMIMETIPAITQYDPLYVYHNLFTAESEGEFNLAQHHFPLVFSIVGMITVYTAYLASRKVQRLEV